MVRRVILEEHGLASQWGWEALARAWRGPSSSHNHDHLHRIHELTREVGELKRSTRDAQVGGLLISQGLILFNMAMFGFSMAGIVASKIARLIALSVGIFGVLGLFCAIAIPYLLPTAGLDVDEYKSSVYSGLFVAAMGTIATLFGGTATGFLV